jgi:hypothetical protein
VRVERGLEHQPLREAGGGTAGDGQAGGELTGADPQRVRAQGRLGRLVAGGHQRAGGVGAERLPPQLGDPGGVRVAQRGGRRPVVRQRADQGGRLARGPAQDRVDQPRPAARVLLGQLHRLTHRGVCGHAVEVGELEDPEPQRRQHRGLEPLGRATGEPLDHVVERGPALDRAVGEPRREREVARVQLQPLGLPAEGAIGPCAVLEDAAQDRVGAPPCWGDGRRPGASFVH